MKQVFLAAVLCSLCLTDGLCLAAETSRDRPPALDAVAWAGPATNFKALEGKTGTFALQHSGTMTRGTPTLAISVVPDSGTGQLAGIAGTMTIVIADGKHSYEFEYTLPSP